MLWASAFVIAALIITQVGRLPGSQAIAEMATQDDIYTLMTTDSGRGGDVQPNELLYVLDSRDQVLLVYDLENARNGLGAPRDGGSLPNYFSKARR